MHKLRGMQYKKKRRMVKPKKKEKIRTSGAAVVERETISTSTKSMDKSMEVVYSSTVVHYHWDQSRDPLHNKKRVVRLNVEISGAVIMMLVSCWMVFERGR